MSLIFAIVKEIPSIAIEPFLIQYFNHLLSTETSNNQLSLINSFLSLELIDEFYLYTSMNSNSDLNIKNPFIIDDNWEVKNKQMLDDDQLTVLEKKEKCLQEL